MTTVDIEAIRERHGWFVDALDVLKNDPGMVTAAGAHSAAIASATDVPLLLNEIERLNARLADAIAADEVKHYHWVKPWSCDTVRDRNVTSRVAELVAAGLAEIPPCTDHLDNGLPESMVRLTPDGMAWVTRARTSKIGTEGEGPGSTSPEPGPPLPWPDFNPAYRVTRCGQSSAHGPHFMDHGPDQPRNCPGTGSAAWEAYQRWATENASGHSTEDGAAC